MANAWAPQYELEHGMSYAAAIKNAYAEDMNIYNLLNRVRRLEAGSIPPDDATEGTVWIDTSNGYSIKIYDASTGKWHEIVNDGILGGDISFNLFLANCITNEEFLKSSGFTVKDLIRDIIYRPYYYADGFGEKDSAYGITLDHPIGWIYSLYGMPFFGRNLQVQTINSTPKNGIKYYARQRLATEPDGDKTSYFNTEAYKYSIATFLAPTFIEIGGQYILVPATFKTDYGRITVSITFAIYPHTDDDINGVSFSDFVQDTAVSVRLLRKDGDLWDGINKPIEEAFKTKIANNNDLVLTPTNGLIPIGFIKEYEETQRIADKVGADYGSVITMSFDISLPDKVSSSVDEVGVQLIFKNIPEITTTETKSRPIIELLNLRGSYIIEDGSAKSTPQYSLPYIYSKIKGLSEEEELIVDAGVNGWKNNNFNIKFLKSDDTITTFTINDFYRGGSYTNPDGNTEVLCHSGGIPYAAWKHHATTKDILLKVDDDDRYLFIDRDKIKRIEIYFKPKGFYWWRAGSNLSGGIEDFVMQIGLPHAIVGGYLPIDTSQYIDYDLSGLTFYPEWIKAPELYSQFTTGEGEKSQQVGAGLYYGAMPVYNWRWGGQAMDLPNTNLIAIGAIHLNVAIAYYTLKDKDGGRIYTYVPEDKYNEFKNFLLTLEDYNATDLNPSEAFNVLSQISNCDNMTLRIVAGVSSINAPMLRNWWDPQSLEPWIYNAINYYELRLKVYVNKKDDYILGYLKKK